MPEKLSDVKALILRILSKGNWVSSKRLLEETKQKYFDRRIRELRDELGYDIESSHVNGEPHYRLRSSLRKEIKVRTYLSASDKKVFLSQNEQKCALCGKEGNIGKDLLWDHRRPLIRNGPGTIDNFQLLCRDCNNQKRVVCQGCSFECSKCYFAYPDQFEKPLIVRPERLKSIDLIKIEAEEMGISLEEYIIVKLNKIIDFRK
ncbi:HNH endonuclease [Leptospira haakeii]|uniref:HNH nuclease domain-containing protein n=1 Tax=Leptospira haakeii TaxID=2023198 RepID=A0ABX4PHF7_9LEPT|nr:HNH endonuclease [Leptospira haakeii]PKA14321.1 hypothetical protein CH363_19165 [Leptospira haakeii]PKA18179.1 hypothetical protein CH377_18920 [Leptospira haakeii]